jgi:hypothetical protein
VESQLNKNTKAELEDFAPMNVEENGGMEIKIKEIKVKLLLINTYALIAVESLVFMEIRKENTAVMTAT